MTTVAAHDQRWIDARPFRAHLLHLTECSGFDWQTVALVAKIPPTVLDRLLHGRGGRPMRRIPPDIARRLYDVTPHRLRKIRERRVPVGPTRALLGQLLDHGWPPAEIAARVDVPTETVAAIIEHRTRRCSKVLALRVQVAHSSIGDIFGRIAELDRFGAADTRQAA